MSAIGAESEKPIVIAGMGPGGLSAAITAARAGHRVIILEPRDHFSRVQRISIDATTLRFLEDLCKSDNEKDRNFITKKVFKTGSEGTVQVKDLQAFLARKLQEDFPDSVEIRRGVGHKIVGIDPDIQLVTFEKPGGEREKIAFSHIIAADGARRGITEILNKSTGNPNFQIEYHTKDMQPRQSEVGTISLTAKPGVVLPEPPVDEFKFNPIHMSRLLDLGWDQPYFPRVYIFRNEENNKFFVSGEIPKMIKNVKNKAVQNKLLEGWGKFMLNVRLGYPAEATALMLKDNPHADKRTAEKNALRTTVFSLEMRAANKSAVELGQGGAFILVGDAYKNANFFFKHGMNDAISDGILAAKCLDRSNRRFDFETYAKQHAVQEKMLATRMGFADSQNEMPLITAQLAEDVAALLSLANQHNNVAINACVDMIHQKPGPMTDHFDPIAYQIQINALLTLLGDRLQNKLNSIVARGRGFRHASEEARIMRAQSQLTEVGQALEKSFRKFYDTSIEQRKKLQSDSPENAPRPRGRSS